MDLTQSLTKTYCNKTPLNLGNRVESNLVYLKIAWQVFNNNLRTHTDIGADSMVYVWLSTNKHMKPAVEYFSPFNECGFIN